MRPGPPSASQFIGGHPPSPSSARQVDRRYSRRGKPGLKEKFEPAVVVPRQCRHNSFLAHFSPILFIEQIADSYEHPCSPLPQPKFGCQIPNIVSRDEAFKRIAVIAECIIHKRSQHREFESILVAINRAG